MKKSRLRWLGHVLSLLKESPARLALHQSNKVVRRPRGRTRKTWVETVNEDLKSCGLGKIYESTTEQLARDRNTWKNIIKACP